MDNNNLAAAQARARKAGSVGIPVRALVFSGIILAFSLMIYVGLEFGYKTYLNAAISSSKKQIEDLDRQAPAKETEKDFLRFYSQAMNIQRLLDNHVAVSPIFDFVERNTYPDVAYASIRSNVPDRSVSFEGVTKTYDRLAAQLALYDSAPETSKVGITGSRFADGVIKFEGKITMAASAFSFADSIKVAPVPTTPAPTPAPAPAAGTPQQTIQP